MSASGTGRVVEFGAFRFDADQHLWRGGTRVALTPKERAVRVAPRVAAGRAVPRLARLVDTVMP